ncbi:MAG: LysM peptidoglycan-binding domain-containing protein, partial [Anaerolineae bacterium]|nr:LysM peptidoglycan-binding domain-containing protein [Anaerolineae bacterium]
PSPSPPAPTETLIRYTVQAGDTLGAIAQVYGTTVEALMTLNNVSDPTLLQIDQELRIPVEADAALVQVTPSPQATLQPQPTTAPHLSSAPVPPHLDELDEDFNPDEVAPIIPSTLDLSLTPVASATAETAAVLEMGITPVPSATVDIETDAGLDSPAVEIVLPPEATTKTHTVQDGDVLIAIAAQYSTTVAALMVANDITDTRGLQVGQALVIPDPDQIPPVPATDTIAHEISSGDTLLALAGQYNSTVEDIMVLNPDLEPTKLQLGDTVLVPITGPPPPPKAEPPPLLEEEQQPDTLLGLARQMLDAVNLQRQIAGLPPYTVDESLTSLALTHAQDMVVRDYFSHTTPEGVTLEDRADRLGLSLPWLGENIQRNTLPLNQTTQYALDWFMRSAAHRSNILNDNYDHIGVGVAEGPVGWYTFVLVFGGD